MTVNNEAIPDGMNYQGRLEKDGFPVTGSKTMRFKLYDDPAAGTELWDSGDQSVTVTQGIFSVVLNIPTAALHDVGGDADQKQRYLEVTVDAVTLSPRDPVRTVPYAAVAETIAGGIDISTAGLSFDIGAIAALVISSITTNVSIGTSTLNGQLNVAPTPDDDLTVHISSQDATAVLVVDKAGQLGIGTNAPVQLIDARNGGDALIRLNADSDNNSVQDAGILLFNHGATQTGQVIYDESADLVTMGYGAANTHLNIDSDGDVGINATAPGNDLTLLPAASGEGFALRESDNGADAALLTANATEGLLRLYELGTARVQLSPDNSLQTVSFIDAGNVGIGTTDPQTKLEVDGTAQFGLGATKSTFTLTGDLQLNSNAGLSVGTTFFVGNGRVGIQTNTPLTTFDVEGNAQFGSAPTKSTFSTTGSLALDTNATLAVGTTFFVNNARVGVGTVSPGSAVHVFAGGAEATPAVQTSGIMRLQNSAAAGDDAIVEVITGASGFGQVCFGDTAAACPGGVRYDHSSNQLDLGTNGTAAQASLTSAGNLSNTGSITAGTNLFATNKAAIGATAVAADGVLDIDGAAFYGSGAVKSTMTAVGDLFVASGASVTLSGGGQVTGLPATPTANDAAASKSYVDTQVGGNTFWSRSGSGSPREVYPETIGDEVGIGTQDPDTMLQVVAGGTANTKEAAGTVAIFQNNAAAGSKLSFGDGSGTAASVGEIVYDHVNNRLEFGTGTNSDQIRFTGTAISGATSITGNAATASALAANGGNCTSGQYAIGVTAAGVAECGTIDGTPTNGSANPVDSDALFDHDALTGTSAHGGSATATNNSIAVRDGSARLVAAQIDTGPGFTEVQLMDQNIRTTDSVTFARVTVGGTAPAVSACGTTPGIAGHDSGGKVTVGTGVTNSCTLTFNSAYASAPACVVVSSAQETLAATTSTTQLIITSASDMDSDVLMYVCFGI
jgi:hypothetical protein